MDLLKVTIHVHHEVVFNLRVCHFRQDMIICNCTAIFWMRVTQCIIENIQIKYKYLCREQSFTPNDVSGLSRLSFVSNDVSG